MSSDKKKRTLTPHKRRSRAISLSPAHASGHSAVVPQFEHLLRERDMKIAELEEKIKAQDVLLENRLKRIERLQKERDELRTQNALLIGKTAELSRKQSFAGFSSSPSPYRHGGRASLASRPSLPPTPDSPKAQESSKESLSERIEPQDSETDYSDMEDVPTTQNGQLEPPFAAPTAKTTAQTEQNGGIPVKETKTAKDNRVDLPKSSGSGAIAQHLQELLKKQPEKAESPLASKDSMSGSYRSVTSNMSSVSEVDESGLETSTTPSSTPTHTASRLRWAEIVREDKSEDVFEESLKDRDYSMRTRTNTLAALNAGSKRHNERGRRRLKEIRKEEKKAKPAIKRQSSLTNLHNDLDFDDENLISPELAAWIRGKILRDLAKKYGGPEKANRSAAIIQRYYRDYKLRLRFMKIQREKHIRSRAQSMRAPGRRPSILKRNRPLKYRREKSVNDVIDPAQKAIDAALQLSKERHGHNHSGARLDLVQQKRKESREKIGEFVSQSSITEVLETCPIDPSDVVVHIEGVPEGESSTDPNKPDGLTEAYSTGDINTRPISIFSTNSVLIVPLSQQEPGVAEVQPCSTQQFRSRKFSVNTARQKRNIGVNHFNRKPTRGIQYLVMSDILEDDPRCVADFLLRQYGLSKEKIGEFLGEINSDFNMAVLECLVEQMDLTSKPIDVALRQFQKIFRMPGEAQKIDRIMEVFAIEYSKANKENALIKSEDAAYMLSFAIMMLHTSLHNPSVRSRITKKQWVTMNRGCNEGEDFSPVMLAEIYDRILETEFQTGVDHTDEVIKLEKQITGLTIPKLANPQRRLLGKFSISEVTDPNSKSYRSHRRTLFVFSDIMIICKHKSRSEFPFKESFSLLNLLPFKFESSYYRFGVTVHSSMEDKIVLQCNCDSTRDRADLLDILEKAIAELNMMETERIAELGTSLAAKPNQDKIIHGGSVKHGHRVNRGPGDVMEESYEGTQNDFVFGVGDIAVNNSGYQSLFRDGSVPGKKENRSSGDSGFDSQQPTPSPSPTDPTHYTPSETPSPLHASHPPPTRYLTPDPSLSSQSTPVTPVHTASYLTPTKGSVRLAPGTAQTLPNPPRSKSSDAIRLLTIIPSNTQDRSPSAELFREEKPSTPPKKLPKPKKEKKKSTFWSRSGRRESNPVENHKGSVTPPVSNKRDSVDSAVGRRERSVSNVDLTQTT